MKKKTTKKEDVEKISKEKIVAKFDLRGIEFKKGNFLWNLKLFIQGEQKEYLPDYLMTLEFDDSFILKNIKDLDEELALAKKDNSLFKDLKEEKIKELENAIKSLKDEMEARKEDVETLIYTAKTSKIDCASGIIVLKIEVEAIKNIINNFHNITDYRVILEEIK